MVLKIQVKEICKFQTNIAPVVDLIYNNFDYIANYTELKHNKNEIARILLSKNFYGFFLLNLDNHIIGYLVGEKMYLNDGRHVFYVSYLYVNKPYRKHGVGGKLMMLLEERCKQWNIYIITLTYDTDDVKVGLFYQNRGFMPDLVLRTYGRFDVLSKYL